MADGQTAIAHQASVMVAVPADDAFAFMCDPLALGRWAIGCLGLEPDGPPGVYVGASIFDGARSWVHIDSDRARRLVDYHIGTVEERQPRISARVICRGDQSIITLTAWRTPGMDDARWEKLCRSHELEVLIIQDHCVQWVARGRA